MIGKPPKIETTEIKLSSGDVFWVSNLGKSLLVDVPTAAGHRRISLSAGDTHRLLLLLNHWMAELPRGN